MDKQIQVFKGEFGEIRTVIVDGEVWFVGKDIADALGYKRSADAIRDRVDSEDKGVGFVQTPGGKQKVVTVNESGMYSLILGSRLDTAKKFKLWVTREVLPSIRKHGMYATDELLDNPDLLIKVATALKEEKERNKQLIEVTNAQQQIIGELKPKADYTDLILKNKGTVTITQIAKDYGMSGTEMNRLLHSLGVQYKSGKQWLLYSKHHSKGYTHSETINIIRRDGNPDVTMNTKWTQKGRLFLYELLKSNDVVPTIEQQEE